MKRSMKKGVNLTIFFVLAFVLLGTSVHADSGLSVVKTVGNKLIAPLTTNKDNKKNPETTPEDTKNAEESVQVEVKYEAQTKLQAIAKQLQYLVDRTQDTISKLQKRGVDTVSAQTALDLAVTSLNKFQADLKVFISLSADSPVVSSTNDKSTATKSENKKEDEKIDAKTALKNIENDLKETRQFLIKSLTELKASVALSLSTNS